MLHATLPAGPAAAGRKGSPTRASRLDRHLHPLRFNLHGLHPPGKFLPCPRGSRTPARGPELRGATLHPPALPSAAQLRTEMALPCFSGLSTSDFPLDSLPTGARFTDRCRRTDTRRPPHQTAPHHREEGNLARAQVFCINTFNLAKPPCTDNQMTSPVSWKGIYRSQIINRGKPTGNKSVFYEAALTTTVKSHLLRGVRHRAPRRRR